MPRRTAGLGWIGFVPGASLDSGRINPVPLLQEVAQDAHARGQDRLRNGETAEFGLVGFRHRLRSSMFFYRVLGSGDDIPPPPDQKRCLTSERLGVVELS